MKLLILILALAAEVYFSDAARWRGFDWLRQLHQALQDATSDYGRAWRALPAILSLLIPMLALLLAWLILTGLFGAWMRLPLGLAVLWYCLGPGPLLKQCRAMIHAANPRELQERLARFNIDWRPEQPDQPEVVTGAIFRAALERWFTVLLWFLLTGVFGALLYRLCERLTQPGQTGSAGADSHEAGWLQRLCWLLEWPAAQLMVALMAIADDFGLVWRQWQNRDLRRRLGEYGHAFMLTTATALMAQAMARQGPADSRAISGPDGVARHARDLLQRMLALFAALLLLLLVARIF